MDIFVEKLPGIKAIAQKIVSKHHHGLEVDELVNAAYVMFDTAITNNPLLVEGQFSKDSTLYFRVKCDMIDYIRRKSHVRRKHQADFITMSYQPEKDVPDNPFEPTCTEQGYEDIENEDLVDALFSKVELTNKEWTIIQSYFYDEKSLKEVGKELGCHESSAWLARNKLLGRLRPHAEALMK